MERLRQAPIPLPCPRPPLRYFLWHSKEDHVVSGSQEGLKGSEKCLGGGGRWHRARGCWLRPPPPQRSPQTLTHRAGFVCGRPLEASQGQCQAPRARLTRRVPPTDPGPQRKWQFSATWKAKRQLRGVLFRCVPRSHPHEESRRGEADRARMACFTWASRHPGSCHSPSSASWLSPPIHRRCPLPRMRSPSTFF